MEKIFILLIIEIFSLSRLNAQPAELTADNGVLKVKLDLTRGGAISYISLSGSNRSLVNIHDEGRYIQQSYYAGKSVDRRAEGQNPAWSPWPWNPIQVGDSYGNRAKILDYKQNGDTLYVKCIPMLWDMNNMPAEAEMEQWTILKKNIIEVHNKLTCHRTDNIYGENILHGQELPAVYPISALNNLYTYLGNAPFKNDTIDNPTVVNLSSGFWGRYPNVSEHWMAFADSNKWGIGVYNSNCTYFLAGMAGRSGGEAQDGSTSYIAPTRKEILNKNTVYEYDYDLIVGTVDEIRQFVYQVGHADTTSTIDTASATEWDFSTSVDGWNLAHSLSDTVVNGILTLIVTGPDPYMISPDNLNINAGSFKYISVTMENNTSDTHAGVFWTTNVNTGFSANMSMPTIPIIPNDSGFATYLVDMTNNSAWTGTIKQLRLDPVQGSSGTVELKQIKLLTNITFVKKETSNLPHEYSLSQNYPNPFNPTTVIKYSILQSGNVTLKVYNLMGQGVATLVNSQLSAGSYKVNFDASKLASGVYFYKLNTGNFFLTKKMVLLK